MSFQTENYKTSINRDIRKPLVEQLGKHESLSKKSAAYHSLLYSEPFHQKAKNGLKKGMILLPQIILNCAVYFGKGCIQVLRKPSTVLNWWYSIAVVIKKGCKHYWSGTKLLAADIRTSCRLLFLALTGSSLSRRQKMLVRVQQQVHLIFVLDYKNIS